MSTLIEALKAKREHAPYFSCATSAGTEVSVVSSWLDAVENQLPPGLKIIEHRANPLDPPDIVVGSPEGIRIGVEVTELVDALSVKASKPPKTRLGENPKPSKLRMPDPWKEYSVKELHELLQKRISRKDNGEFKGQPYDENHLVIYSDEPDLVSVYNDENVRNLSFEKLHNLDCCWLLLSLPPRVNDTDPNSENCLAISLVTA